MGKFSLWFLLLSICFLVNLGFSVNYESQTKKFIQAVQSKDAKAVFDMWETAQEQILRIKANQPKILWDKSITDFYTSATVGIFSNARDRRGSGAMISLLSLHVWLSNASEWKILETRGNNVFVSMEFLDVKKAPCLYDQLLREAILVFQFSERGFYIGHGTIDEGNKFWEQDKIPFDVLAVESSATVSVYREARGLDLTIHVLGGTPPYEIDLRLGECRINKLPGAMVSGTESEKEKSTLPVLARLEPRRPGEAHRLWIRLDKKGCGELLRYIKNAGITPPYNLELKIVDSRGSIQEKVFEAPALFINESQCWISNPWLDWDQGPGNIFEARELKKKTQGASAEGVTAEFENRILTKPSMPPSGPESTVNYYFKSISQSDTAALSVIMLKPTGTNYQSWKVSSVSEEKVEPAMLPNLEETVLALRKKLEEHVGSVMEAQDNLSRAQEELKAARTEDAIATARKKVEEFQTKFDQERERHRGMQASYKESNISMVQEESAVTLSLGVKAENMPTVKKMKGNVHSKQIDVEIVDKSMTRSKHRFHLRRYNLQEPLSGKTYDGKWIIIRIDQIEQ
jgi:hypothetical protein